MTFMNASPIVLIIFGPFRSGTSLTSALLHAMGADFGPPSAISPQPDRYNPTGYFQRKDVVACNDQLIRDAHHSFFSPTPCQASSLPVDVGDAFKELDLAWTDNSKVVAFKDPRFSMTWPLWAKAELFERAEVRLIRVHRDLKAVARSAAQHRFVGRYCDQSPEKALEMSRAMDDSARMICSESNCSSFTVDYNELLASPAEECEKLCEFALGMPREVANKAAKLIGKNGALRRHYTKKLMNPRAVLSAALKTTLPSLR